MRFQLSLIFGAPRPKPKWTEPHQAYHPKFIPQHVWVPVAQKNIHMTFWMQHKKDVSFRYHQSEVRFTGPVNDQRKRNRGMRSFFISMGHRYIAPRLDALSEHLQMPYKTLRFKHQKSLWGSCSDLSNINLNIRLLFLPLDLVDYVLVHELCHTRHMNHSKAFWELVSSHCHDYKAREKELDHAHRYIPRWFFRI